MKTLLYTIIKSRKQYLSYCHKLEELILRNDENVLDQIELLTLLIEKWDSDNEEFNDLDPIQLIKGLMQQNDLKAKDLAEIIGLSKGTISKILNYHKGLSKETIRKLSHHFKISQSAFNRPFKLIRKEELKTA